MQTDGMLTLPPFTMFDAVTQGVAGVVYLLVGIAAFAHAPRDIRARVFLAVALANAVTFEVPSVLFARGVRDASGFGRWPVATIFCGLVVGSVMLFHFTQVFPKRRPLLLRWGRLLPIAYVVPPLAVLALILAMPEDLTEITLPFAAVLAIGALPLLIFVGFVLPIAAILSLVKSYREAIGELALPRRSLFWLLVSQIAGGTIAVLFAPVLAVIAPNSTAQIVLKTATWLLGLMTPGAFALAVWKDRLLDRSAAV